MDSSGGQSVISRQEVIRRVKAIHVNNFNKNKNIFIIVSSQKEKIHKRGKEKNLPIFFSPSLNQQERRHTYKTVLTTF